MSRSASNSEKEVVSKYFAEGKPVMDESISEFQEPKHSCKGPKTATVAQKSSKTSNKKKTKKIKGQKDIRVVLKSKKNELLEYAKDFDNVCKKSGLDVDSEQLQLAIALSKSLQNSESAAGSSSHLSECLKSHERIGKIRTTLQEYGFKVPEVKKIKKRRLEEFKKNSKLLLITAAERTQNIIDRYSQVLFKNISNAKFSNNNSEETNEFINNVPLYDIATNVPYNSIKSDAAFYVDKLIEISPNSVGCLLRDWSQIPGRPLSPVSKKSVSVQFTELTLEMEEIDAILSGTLDKAQEIMKKRKKLENITDKDYTSNKDVEEIIELSNSPVEVIDMGINCKVHHITLSSPSQPVRCASPDLFDDEFSSITDNTKENALSSQKSVSPISSLNYIAGQPNQISQINVTRKKSNDFMDLTECVNDPSQSSTSRIENAELVIIDNLKMNKTNVCNYSQNVNTDLTRRKSDDFMEITGCASQVKFLNKDIDLTQSPDIKGEETIIVVDLNETAKKSIDVDALDLTQSSNSNDTLPFVEIRGKSKKSPVISLDTDDEDQTICIDNDKCFPNHSILEKEEIKLIDSCPFEEYVFPHSPDNRSSSENNEKFMASQEVTNLTQKPASSEGTIFCKSNNLEVDNNSLGKKDDVSIDYDDIIICRDDSRTDDNYPSYGTKDGSKDFLVNQLSTSSDTKSGDFGNISYMDEDKNIDIEGPSNHVVSNPHSEVFEISDEELNYSIHKSKHLDNNSQESNEFCYEIPKENFDFGGLSIFDDISANLQVSKRINNYTNNENNRTNDSFLPDIEIKGTKVKTLDGIQLTPEKKLVNDKLANIQTPSNREYIIKTNQVTPMLDYESMSTPDRNKELDKYGLKPFKRKRAIQLLTHLYNQTHPQLETCVEDLPSPSKKRKANCLPSQDSTQKSPKKAGSSNLSISEDIRPFKSCKTKSPRKCPSKSPKKVVGSTSSEGIDKENVEYEETCVIPSIKEVHCSPEDWVFQKREKAKVHSCRVPLHIAFHNYVMSRRGLREAILRYEPVNIDVIHKELVGYGHRYDPKDLLRFLDKKCVTVKTVDNNTRYMKKSQKKS